MWLHIVAAASWVGSMVFFATILVPLLRTEVLRDRAPKVIALVGARYRVLGWVALTVLLVTGATSLALRGLTLEVLTTAAFWSDGFGRLLAYKLALVAVLVAFTLAHEVLARRDSTATSPAERERTRRHSSLLGRALLLVSLAIVLLAVAMVRGWA